VREIGGDRPKIIRVVKKTRPHAVHHGGSWKVAYADFVTALMAFFLVMWIVGMDQNVKRAVEGYFSNPVGYKHGYGSGRSPISSGNSPAAARSSAFRTVAYMREEQQLATAQNAIAKALKASPELRSVATHVQIVLAQSGLRIELVEGDSGQTFFSRGSAALTPIGRLVVTMIGRELAQLSNPVVIEGHTDAAPYGNGTYTNWELSADRANAARRVLQAAGLPERRVAEVKGMADRDLRDPAHPLSPANRRVTILLPFQHPPPAGPDSTGQTLGLTPLSGSS
jgi:chemotaxis protein MotB